jgi:hypothetical protein
MGSSTVWSFLVSCEDCVETAQVALPDFHPHRFAEHSVLAFGQKRLCSIDIVSLGSVFRFKPDSLTEMPPRTDWIWDVADASMLYPEAGGKTFAIITAKNIVEFVRVLPGNPWPSAPTIACQRCAIHSVVFCASIVVKSSGVWVASGAVTNDVSSVCFVLAQTCVESELPSPISSADFGLECANALWSRGSDAKGPFWCSVCYKMVIKWGVSRLRGGRSHGEAVGWTRPFPNSFNHPVSDLVQFWPHCARLEV